jgi:hypothetical protein
MLTLHPIASISTDTDLTDPHVHHLTEDGDVYILDRDNRVVLMDPSGRILLKSKQILGQVKRIVVDGRRICTATIVSTNVLEVECPPSIKKQVKIYGDEYILRMDRNGNVWEFVKATKCYYNGELVHEFAGVDKLGVVAYGANVCYTKRGSTITTMRWSYEDKSYHPLATFNIPNDAASNMLHTADVLVVLKWSNLTLWDVKTGVKLKTLDIVPDITRYMCFDGGMEIMVRRNGLLTTLGGAKAWLTSGHTVRIRFANGILCVFDVTTQTVHTWGLEDAKARPSVLALFSSFGPPTTPLGRFLARDGDHALVTRVLSMLVPFAQ